MLRDQILLVVAALPAALAIPASALEKSPNHKYCIIGAGPAGIQLGQFLKGASLSYVIFERGDRAGAFFEKYPVHRTLISFNRRQTKSTNPEFNLRHDWNSLLATKVPPFTTWTEDFYPSADTLVEYLQAVAREQEGSILFRHDVISVRRARPDEPFEVNVRSDSDKKTWTCQVVIAATGLWRPNVPNNWIQGLHYALGYEELSPWPGGRAFANLSVLILGNGNAAFETADAIRNWAADIAIIGRREQRFAYESRYVGDVRLHRGTSVDSLMLKNLDEVYGIPPHRGQVLELIPCGPGGKGGGGQGGMGWPQRRWDSDVIGFRGRPGLCVLPQLWSDYLLIADHDLEHPAVIAAKERWPEELVVKRLDDYYSLWHKNWLSRFGSGGLPGIEDAAKGNKSVLAMDAKTVRRLANTSADFRAALPALLETTEGLWLEHSLFRKPFDVVVRALGWLSDLRAFEGLNIQMDKAGKYPKVDACFRPRESDLFFAGSTTHGFDKRRYGSAGGFIHGFRYTTRSLFRCLQHQYEGKALWSDARNTYSLMPASTCPSTDASKCISTGSAYRARRELEQNPLWAHLMRRLNEASGLYQMSCGALTDGVVYNTSSGEATYVEDIPYTLFEAEFRSWPRLVFQYRFAKKVENDPAQIGNSEALHSRWSAFGSEFIHPVLGFSPAKSPPAMSKSGKSIRRLHLMQDRWTDFAGREHVLAVHEFLTQIEASILNGSLAALNGIPRFHERVDGVSLTCNHHHGEESRQNPSA